MIIKSYFKKIKNKLISSCIAIGLVTSAFTGLAVANNASVYAYSSGTGSSSSYFTDPTFSQGGLTPTSWSRIEDEGNFNSERMVGGIFDSDDPTDSYLKSYKVFFNPGLPTGETISSSSDPRYNSLSISAPYPAGGNFGYKPSNSKLNLEKDSFYIISVNLKTLYGDTTDSILHDVDKNTTYAKTVDSRASLYISGFSNEEIDDVAKFEMIDSRWGKESYNSWGTFSFYIATNQLQNESALDLEVWLGSKTQVSTGNVFFNNVTVERLDQNTFEHSIASLGSQQHSKIVDLRDAVNTSPITNSNFENDNLYSGWKVVTQDPTISSISDIYTSSFKDSDLYKKHNLSTTDLVGTNLRSNDGKVLFMANSEESYTLLESKDELTFERQKYYKVSVWGWSNSTGSSISVKLVNTTDGIEIDPVSIGVNTSTTDTNNPTNGWQEYSFYVYGDEAKDTTAKLQFEIGSEETASAGYAYFDNITVQEINYKQFSDNNANSNSVAFNYNKDAEEVKIPNFTFNITENEEVGNAYPLAPASWTYAEETLADNSTMSGVVNIHSTLFNAEELKLENSVAPYNPGKFDFEESESYNNVLLMGSKYNSKQTYTSSSFSLDANAYYKLSVYVAAKSGSANIKVYNNNGVLYEKTNITANNWTNYSVYIKTSSSESDVKIELSLINNTDETKYVYFDEVLLSDSSEEVYNEIVANSLNTKVNLVNYSFDDEIDNSGTANGFSTSSSAEHSFAKIQNTSEEYGITAHSGDKALVVGSTNNTTGVNYYATTKRAYTLSTNSYYKISLFVKTLNIENGGATITVSGTGLNKSFYNINTESGNSNEWTEYTFYIHTKTDCTATLQLGIGNEDTLSSGYAMFDDITFEKLTVEDDAAFEALTANLNNETNQVVVVEDAADEEEEENKEDKDLFEGSFNWYIVTSLITALAIIIAVVGVMLRKVNFKHNKKVKTSYDRRKTLDVSLDKKERIAKRQAEIKLLEQQLKEIEDEIAGINKEVEEEKAAFNAQHDEAKAEIIARRDAITKEKETALHERNEKIAKDKNAFTREEEEKFAEHIKKLEKQELKETQQLQKHDKAISNFKTKHTTQLQRILARKEFIQAEIARIDAEIEAIAREEAQIWEDYKQAKADAKKRKAEYIAEQKSKKASKEANKTEEIETETEAKVETTETKEEVKEEAEVEIINPDEK